MHVTRDRRVLFDRNRLRVRPTQRDAGRGVLAQGQNARWQLPIDAPGAMDQFASAQTALWWQWFGHKVSRLIAPFALVCSCS